MPETISLEDGKYLFKKVDHTVVIDRYGESWRELLGDKAVAALFDHALALEEVVEDHKRLVREIDAAISAPDQPAKQASLCDLVGPIKTLKVKADALHLVVSALSAKAGVSDVKVVEMLKLAEEELRAKRWLQ